MKVTYGDTSNTIVAKLPFSEASMPKPASGLRFGLPIVYVPLGASMPSAKSSWTVGARNERAKFRESVSSPVNRCIDPAEAVKAFDVRDSSSVRKTESVDEGSGLVWM